MALLLQALELFRVLQEASFVLGLVTKASYFPLTCAYHVGPPVRRAVLIAFKHEGAVDVNGNYGLATPSAEGVCRPLILVSEWRVLSEGPMVIFLLPCRLTVPGRSHNDAATGRDGPHRAWIQRIFRWANVVRSTYIAHFTCRIYQ